MPSSKRPRQPLFFTPSQATATLPLVRSIVRDITTLAVKLREEHTLFQPSKEKVSLSPAHDEERRARLRSERDLEEDLARLRELENELADLGVELKDYFQGLVDFPGIRNGRPVLLCWKYDEPEVSHWHERDAGFAGRQPLTGEWTTEAGPEPQVLANES